MKTNERLGKLRLSVYADKHHQSFAPINIIHHVEMRHFWSLAVLLCCLATHSSGQTNKDFYTTVSTLSDLIHVEKQVKVDLLRYVERLGVVQDSILKQPYDDLTSLSAVSDYLKHPVHSFQLIKRMTAGLKTVEAQIKRMRKFARDCLNISQVALHQGMHDLAVKWAEQAVAKAADEEPPSIPKQELGSHYEAVVTKVLRSTLFV
ncbi:hypothetical protein HPB47_006159 [Ixodes persulcatus]|uniref:Uncharacterized protein n=1 Tax=Ixodes persulcatus TaxID=34615 RepID=A0AC60PAX5_IXOPE|nr:hypothetical protein HPB47_006159 [Ixodes persulcatus]